MRRNGESRALGKANVIPKSSGGNDMMGPSVVEAGRIERGSIHQETTDQATIEGGQMEAAFIDLDQVKVTPRDQQVLNLLVQGCSNKEIAGQLNISPRTVKQHLRTLFLRAGIREGRKRVKLAIAMFSKEEFTRKEAHS